MPTTQESIDFIISPQVAIGTDYFSRMQVERGKFHGRNFPAIPPIGEAIDPYIMTHYYDLGLGMAVAHQRTNDPEFLALFEKVEDSWWMMPWIDSGKKKFWLEGSVTPDPRHVGLKGLTLRALKRPEMWEWLNGYERFHLDHWLLKRVNDPTLFYGVRPGGFTLQAAAMLAKCLPDSFPSATGMVTNGAQLRAQYLADAEKIAVQYYGRLQQADGSWRWDDWDYTDADGGHLKGIMQPFMVGILLNALIDVHRVSTNETVRTSIQNQITRACRHLYNDGPYMTQVVPSLGVRRRGMAYFYHGGTTVNPTKYAKGDLPDNWDTRDASDVQNMRQGISTIIAAYGYAFFITGDAEFKRMGDELWEAAYGETDRVRNYMAGDAKSYNQNCSFASRYPAWAGGVVIPTPEPLPNPLPTPQPPAPQPPAPQPPQPPQPASDVPTARITSPSEGEKLSGRVSVTVEVADSVGVKEVYLVRDNDVVIAHSVTAPYTLNLDTRTLVEGAHSLYVRAWNTNGRPGNSEKVNVMVANAAPVPTPTPDPVPDPPKPPEPPVPQPPTPPTPLPTISAPASITIPRNGSGKIEITLSNLTEPITVTVLGSSGQVTVSPLSQTTKGTSSILTFSVKVKGQSRTITFDSPVGRKLVKVNVG